MFFKLHQEKHTEPNITTVPRMLGIPMYKTQQNKTFNKPLANIPYQKTSQYHNQQAYNTCLDNTQIFYETRRTKSMLKLWGSSKSYRSYFTTASKMYHLLVFTQ